MLDRPAGSRPREASAHRMRRCRSLLRNIARYYRKDWMRSRQKATNLLEPSDRPEIMVLKSAPP
jgi:hypothetical protein